MSRFGRWLDGTGGGYWFCSLGLGIPLAFAAFIAIWLVCVDGARWFCSGCMGSLIMFAAALTIPNWAGAGAGSMRRLRFLIWATFITLVWLCMHYDEKGDYWAFGRGLKGRDVNHEGWWVREPITPVNILIDFGALAIPIGLLWVYMRPDKPPS